MSYLRIFFIVVALLCITPPASAMPEKAIEQSKQAKKRASEADSEGAHKKNKTEVRPALDTEHKKIDPHKAAILKRLQNVIIYNIDYDNCDKNLVGDNKAHIEHVNTLLKEGIDPNDSQVPLLFEALQNNRPCAPILIEHNATTVIPAQDSNAIASIIYPHHTLYTHAVGKPDVLNALKKRCETVHAIIYDFAEKNDLEKKLPPGICDIITQYVVLPIEIGIVDQIHNLNSEWLKNQLKDSNIQSKDRVKGLLTALALRHFTPDPQIKTTLTQIAHMLIDNDTANECYINYQGKQVGPALHIAVLSDKDDGSRYIDPQPSSLSSSSSARSAASTTTSVITALIQKGADETVVDATGKTAKEHAQRYLVTPALMRQNARDRLFDWMY